MRSPGEIFEFTIRDPDSADVITLKYRKPYTREKLRYNLSLWNLEKKEYKSDEEVDEARTQWGGKIVEGVELLSRKKSISSNPESPNYLPTWKEWLNESAPQVLETLAFKAFQGVDLNRAENESAPEKKSPEEVAPEKKS